MENKSWADAAGAFDINKAHASRREAMIFKGYILYVGRGIRGRIRFTILNYSFEKSREKIKGMNGECDLHEVTEHIRKV